MEKREILILSSWYPTKNKPFLGNFVVRNAQLLGKYFSVTVVNTIPSDCLKELSLKENNRNGYREIEVIHPRGKNILSKKRWQKKALNYAFLKTNRFHLIIGHTLQPKGLQFVASKKKFNIPLILIEHGSYYRVELRNKWTIVEELILKYTRKHIDEVVAVSKFLKQDIKRDFPKHKIKIIGNHVNTDTFNIGEIKSNKRTEFLHISTLDVKTKNPQGIIDACLLLRKTESNFHLTIICDEDYSRWEREVKSKELSKHISFKGPLAWDDLVPYYQKADAFILNSNYESFAIVIAEAWSTGTPVISTSVGIASELDPVLGIQTEKNNPESIEHAMKKIINTKSDYKKNKIREKSMEYSEQVILKKWMKIIDKYVK